MIADIHSKSGFPSRDFDRTRSKDQKLKEIAETPVDITPFVTIGGVSKFRAKLPYTYGAEFSLVQRSIWADIVDVGDEELYGHGIGSRFVRAALTHAESRSPEHLKAVNVRLGMINTVVKLLGAKNTTIGTTGQWFGGNSQEPLEAMFKVNPPEEKRPYVVPRLIATIEWDRVRSWDERITVRGHEYLRP